jgi:hypothetical protein
MKARTSTVLNTAHNVQGFMDQNEAVLGPNITSARRNLDDAVDQLTAMAVSQASGVIASRGATAFQQALRSNLRNGHMKAIAQVAKIALPDVPEIQQLAVPAGNLSGPALVTAAHGMADAAEKYTSVFTQHGMADDFIPQLRSAADAVTQSAIGRNLTKSNTVSATFGIRAQEKRVRTLVKLLNALIVPKLGTNATLLSKWRAARAIDHQSPIVPVPSTVASASGTAAAGNSNTPAAGSTGTTGSTPAGSTPPASTTPAGSSPASTTPVSSPPAQ